MATRPAGAGGASEVSVQIPAEAADAEVGGKLQQRERMLNSFVRVVAFGEWAGNAFGALAFLWATGVLLGGFCSDLQPMDFWFAMVIIFIEAFRIFSRNYKLDNSSLFGTTRALRWINVSFARILGRPQEGNEVVLMMGMWINLLSWLPVYPVAIGILQAALLIFMSKMLLRGPAQTSPSQRRRRLLQLQLWAILTAFIILYALRLVQARDSLTYPTFISDTRVTYYRYHHPVPVLQLVSSSAEILAMVVAAFLLISRPRIIGNLISAPWGHSLISSAKLISAVSLVYGLVLLVGSTAFEIVGVPGDPSNFIVSFTTVVLSLGSLQTPASNSQFACWIDVILHILFLWYLVSGIPSSVFFDFGWAKLFSSLAAGLSTIVLVVAVLLIENLQIPAAVIQVLLSSVRIQTLHSDYAQQGSRLSSNMVPAIEVFYVLALCQGSLYITAIVLGLFSIFPRRSLVRQSKLSDQRGAKAVDVYYESAYATCMETGLFSATKTLSFASFAVESLSSKSSEIRLAGVLLLDNLLRECKEADYSQELRTNITMSKKKLSTLVSMLGWADERHRDIRITASRVIANLADRLTVAETPGMLKLLYSLLDAGNNLPDQEISVQTSSSNGGNAGSQRTDEELLGQAQDKQGGCYWLRWCWQRMKDKWSLLEELPLTRQESLPILGMEILEKLAHDPDNCVEISKRAYLISKIIGLISYSTDCGNSNDEQQCAVICASLNFVWRLAITGNNIGVELRQELCSNSFLLNNLECVLEDSRSSPQLKKLVIDILTKLAWDEDARREIGSCKVTICKLMHAFIRNDGPTTNPHYDSDQSLRMAAGEALANLTTESPANCLVILEETGYEIIKDLKNMLCEDEFRYVAASLLQNICAHAKDKLRHQDASNHLSSAFPMVMENIMSAEGKHLEVLMGLASQICDMVPESFIYNQLQTDRSELVQKLVGTLNSNKKPNPEYPRMRRVIVEMVISILKLCPGYATMLSEGGMVEALTKVEMTPSKVEKHKVFYGNIGVVLESGPSLTALVTTAKGLIHSDGHV